ncbi:hypothetical protein F383_13714 [Gossypium arboreum]|uniref:Uncharacterized protein n=1 Tax=Gossypium arboreum TaxID=29729 RepID=A0A0B0PWF6_GOSAR|nr:hypothetical protein F383_13714 [Gossypium arboreum]
MVSSLSFGSFSMKKTKLIGLVNVK